MPFDIVQKVYINQKYIEMKEENPKCKCGHDPASMDENLFEFDFFHSDWDGNLYNTAVCKTCESGFKNPIKINYVKSKDASTAKP